LINLLINSIELIVHQPWITLTINNPRSTIPIGGSGGTDTSCNHPPSLALSPS